VTEVTVQPFPTLVLGLLFEVLELLLNDFYILQVSVKNSSSYPGLNKGQVFIFWYKNSCCVYSAIVLLVLGNLISVCTTIPNSHV